eukprot:COSAG04_NODE_13963_length_585_cov_1.388889_1_plen_177_part_01
MIHAPLIRWYVAFVSMATLVLRRHQAAQPWQTRGSERVRGPWERLRLTCAAATLLPRPDGGLATLSGGLERIVPGAAAKKSPVHRGCVQHRVQRAPSGGGVDPPGPGGGAPVLPRPAAPVSPLLLPPRCSTPASRPTETPTPLLPTSGAVGRRRRLRCTQRLSRGAGAEGVYCDYGG